MTKHSELLSCPLCSGASELIELRYANTGGLYGFAAECGECGLKLRRQPAGWEMGKREETLAAAKKEVEVLWNTRPPYHDLVEALKAAKSALESCHYSEDDDGREIGGWDSELMHKAQKLVEQALAKAAK